MSDRDQALAMLRQSRVVAMDAHRAEQIRHREAHYRNSLPETVQEARLSRFHARDAADAAVLASARQWVQGIVEGGKTNLAVFGPVGTGKTWLLAAIGWALLPTQRPAVYLRAPLAWAAIRATYDGRRDESESDLMGRWVGAPVLLLDELGAGHVTDAYRAFVAEVIGRRTDDGRPTVVASNLGPADWVSACDERAADRMAGGVQLPVLGASRRGAAA
ncbi:MAG: hypothetical protein EPN60_16950 [Nevskiaceae bacterium]|nr:MAG: hypothetical protein EPN60_16950 [Nevskiaceae bacterium]